MPVRAYIQFEIICDRCSHSYSYTSEDVEENWSEHREEIEKALRGIGYLIVDKLTLCPECVERMDV
jgi:hypothetical protein